MVIITVGLVEGTSSFLVDETIFLVTEESGKERR